MKNPMKSILMSLGVTLAIAQPAAADNPVIQTRHTADPAPMVANGKVYLYTGHDEDNANPFVMKDWRCYSTKDMVNWTDEGSPLSVKDFSWAQSDAWAGQAIERNRKFYYYVPMTAKGLGMSVGVAVSDSPTGPFHDPLGHPLVHTGEGDIDPTVYIDDDGQAYLYWGNPHLFYVKLNKDMVSYDQSVGIVKVPLTEEGFGKREGNKDRLTLYEEGPWFYHRGSLYYMVFAATGVPEALAYSTSTSPTGPWTYRGIIMPKGLPKLSFTNHPGVLDYKGHSYLFYHNEDLPGGSGFDRSVCLEEFKYNPDGSFPTILPTKDGPAPIGHLNPYESTKAATIAWESGVQTETSATVGVYVTDIDDGDYIKVKSVDFGSGAKSFCASVAAETSGSNIEIHLDSLTGPLVGSCPVPSTGGGQKWVTKSCNVIGAKGVHDLYFAFTGGSGYLFNFDWWKFSKKDAS